MLAPVAAPDPPAPPPALFRWPRRLPARRDGVGPVRHDGSAVPDARAKGRAHVAAPADPPDPVRGGPLAGTERQPANARGRS